MIALALSLDVPGKLYQLLTSFILLKSLSFSIAGLYIRYLLLERSIVAFYTSNLFHY